jgi:predicted amidohydrolase YtcJ
VPSSSAAADLVLRDGAVHTVDPANPSASAIAVRGGLIVAVGADRDVAGLIGPTTRVIELRGRTVLPGFQDAHCHPVTSGVDQLRCDLLEVRGGRLAALDAIRTYATSHPDEPWIVGSGWYMADFPNGLPHRRDLDPVVRRRPTYLDNRDGHSAWVSSSALALAGIDATTPDPVGGRIERDPDGTPTGVLHEDAAELVEAILPAVSAATLERGLLHAQAYFHALGITAWQDAHVEPEDEAVYLALAGRGQLTMRTIGAQWFGSSWDVDAIPALVDRRATSRADRFAATSIKIMVDGVLETFTGALLEPYLGSDGQPTDRTGLLFFDPDRLRRVVVELDRQGFQVHFHVIGDRAARVALDALDAAMAANGPTDGRHHLAHIQVIQPDDLPRFAALGAVANAQALWAGHEPQMDELTIPFLGPVRASWQYPFGSLLRSGARLAMGSDWAVSTPNVMEQVQVAVERVHHSLIGRVEPFYPAERLTLDQAIEAFTLGSAYVNHLDDRTGSIEVGKLADLAVLDRDLWDRGAGLIAEARVVGTFIDGRPVFEDAGLDG